MTSLKINVSIPVEITVDSYTPGVPGRFSGPPENCYPDEPPEVEFTVRTLTDYELNEDDFDRDAWENLYFDVLEAIDSEIEDAKCDAQISALEYRYVDD